MRLALLKTNDYNCNAKSNGTTVDDLVSKNIYCKSVISQLKKCD